MADDDIPKSPGKSAKPTVASGTNNTNPRSSGVGKDSTASYSNRNVSTEDSNGKSPEQKKGK